MKPTSKKIGKAHQEGRGQHGPDGAIAAEFQQQPVRQRAAAAGVLEEPADHGAQADHYGDESERVAESELDGLEDFLRSHSGCQSQGHAGDEQSQERVQPHRQNQEQEEGDRCQSERDQIGTVCGHESALYCRKVGMRRDARSRMG